MLLVSINCLAQLSFFELVQEASIELKIPRDNIDDRLLALKNISETEAVLVLPIFKKEQEEVIGYNAHILIVDRYVGAINSRFFETKVWSTGPLVLNNIRITTDSIGISKEIDVIGVLVSHVLGSSVVLHRSDKLNLFARDGIELSKIMDDFEVYEHSGEYDRSGNSHLESHSKNFYPISSENVFKDLKVIDTITKMEMIDGAEKPDEVSEDMTFLKFEGKAYRLHRQ